MKHNAGKHKTEMIFILLQSVLYISFLVLDLTDSSDTLSNRIKYSMIIVCFCYALFYKNSAGKGILFCMKGALLFTLISDLFLLILDDQYYLYGVLTFIIAQQLYSSFLILYSCQDKGQSKRFFWCRLILRMTIQAVTASIICLILQRVGITLEALLVASVFYFISILTNTIIACKMAFLFKNPFNKNKDRGLLLFALGMCLFLLCDINVGLFNLSGFLSLPRTLYDRIYEFSSILMWMFYAPSQVLITLSILRIRKSRNNLS